MSIADEIAALSNSYYVALILDNEVTVGEFVVEPPLPWRRLVRCGEEFEVAPNYPCSLTTAQAEFEMRNWDEVSLPAIARAVTELASRVDYLLFGNNAGQGLPLAGSLQAEQARSRSAIIYARSLPEKDAYRDLGYENFWPRREAAARLLEQSRSARRPLSLWFINTIQHNEVNFHRP